MWSTGYNIPKEADELKARSVSLNSEFVNSFGKIAKELNMAIGITFLEEYEPLPRNTMCLFDRFGNNVLTYAKAHTCDFGDEFRIMAGDDFYVADLDTNKGNIKVGAMICINKKMI